MPLRWSDEYAIGIPQIDDQHRELFRRIGILHEALFDGRAGEELISVFDFLDDYTRTHFQDEEALMEAHGYTLLPQHRAQHQELIRRLAAWKAGVNGDDLRLILSAATTLAEWLRGHITMSDRDLAYVIRARGKAA